MEKDGEKVKVICLGDSAVGKSKLVERFLMDGYKPQQLSTYALTLFNYSTSVDDHPVNVEFWDTAGQERFSSLHPSYYHSSHACVLILIQKVFAELKNLFYFLRYLKVFDVTRKTTYKNLATWYKELRDYRPDIPCILIANKIDVDYSVTKKSFNFSKKHNLPFYFVSASDGTNVVKVFREAIKLGFNYKQNATDFVDEVLKELENFDDMSVDSKASTSNSTSPSSFSDNSSTRDDNVGK